MPHFYTVKLGFTGVYIIFLISALQKYENYQIFSSIIYYFHLLVVKFSIYLNRRVFVMTETEKADVFTQHN